jgi:hypothetical protein
MKTMEIQLEDKEIKFLPATNNKMENYFGRTLPKYLKKLFKTVEGITIYLNLQRIKWEQNHEKIIFSHGIFNSHNFLQFLNI